MEHQTFWPLKGNWWGWSPQTSQPTQSGKKKGSKSISYYSNITVFVTYIFSSPNALLIFLSSTLVLDTLCFTTETSEENLELGKEEAGHKGMWWAWQEGDEEVDLSWGHSTSQRCSCQSSAITYQNDILMPSISVPLVSSPWWEFSEKIYYNQMKLGNCLWKCP